MNGGSWNRLPPPPPTALSLLRVAWSATLRPPTPSGLRGDRCGTRERKCSPMLVRNANRLAQAPIVSYAFTTPGPVLV